MLNVNSWLLTAAEVYWPGTVLRTGSGMAQLCGLSLLWALWEVPVVPQDHCTQLTPGSNQYWSVLAKQVVNCRLPRSF